MRLSLQWLWLLVALGLPLAPGGLTMPPPTLAQTAPNAAQLEEADRLLNLGVQQVHSSQYREALQSWQTALAIYQALGNRLREAQTLMGIGGVYRLQENYAEALTTYQQSLATMRELGDQAGVANTLMGIGDIYEQQGNYGGALTTYQESLTLFRELSVRELSDRANEVTILTAIGIIHENQGNYWEALSTYQQGLAIIRELGIRGLGERAEEATILNNIGLIYEEQANYAEALKAYQQSLAIMRELGNHQAEEATILNNIGIIYAVQGNYEEALNTYQQSLAIKQELENRAGVAITMGNIGNVYQRQGNYAEALTTYQQSLAIMRELDNNRAGEATALNNIGIIYAVQENYAEALNACQESLAIKRELGNRAVEAPTLHNIGLIYEAQKNYAEALATYQHSLTISREMGDRKSEAITLNSIGALWHAQGETALAIVFLKESVNVYEDIRQSNQSLEQSLQDSYLTTIEDPYRFLADLLLDQGRILEAQQVLELLKVEELREFTRASYSGGTLTYDPAERPIVEAHGSLIALGAAIAQCHPNCSQILYDQQIALEEHFDKAVTTFEDIVRHNRAQDDVFYDPASLSSDALELVNAQPGTVLIYPVVLEDRLWLLWTATGGVVGRVEVSVSQSELRRAAVRFRELLERQDDQAYNEFKAISQQLYGWLIAPLEAELEKNSIRHLIFAQDRTTRYLPMAALYNGNQYLIENYTISTVLSAALTDTTDRLGEVNASPVLGLGLTRSFPGYRALPNVSIELNNVVRTAEDPTGIYPGQVFLDERFTFAALSENVRHARILHIATHAEFVPHAKDASYILSGTGEQLTISQIGSLDTQFSNLHLVVLSACQTALGGAALDGTEIAGVSSYFLGRNRAETVMATLWKVDDAGTSLLMQRFYTLLATGELTKAEALRQAQLSLLKGEATLDERMANLGVSRGFELAEPEESSVGLAHPYYWAPFILIGNPL